MREPDKSTHLSTHPKQLVGAVTAALSAFARHSSGPELYKMLDQFVTIFAAEADRGNRPALCSLATLAMESVGTYDFEVAARTSAWFVFEAARCGYAPAQHQVGFWLETSGLPRLGTNENRLTRSSGNQLAQAVDWYRKAARQGDTYARLDLARILTSCDLPTAPSDAEVEQAATWLRESANSGDADAQFELAKLIESGKIDGADGEARHYCQLAAQQGNADAKVQLGRLLEAHGDVIGALQLYRDAMSTTFCEGAEYYAGRLLLGDSDLQNVAEGLRYLKSAANDGDERAQHELDQYNSVFHLSDEDEQAIQTAISVAEQLLSSSAVTTEQAKGLRHALLALQQMPEVTSGISCDFGVTYRAGDASFSEMRFVTVAIDESRFAISLGGSQYHASVGSDSLSEPGYVIEIAGYRARGCDLDAINDTIAEYLHLGGNIHVSDESECER